MDLLDPPDSVWAGAPRAGGVRGRQDSVGAYRVLEDGLLGRRRHGVAEDIHGY
jgi:hypothetical protein